MSAGIGAALEEVRRRIAASCERAGRPAGSVRLVAVSKAVSPARVREAAACGQRLFGENRVQEALAKMDALGEAVEWHMIGHLQRNKARQAVGRFALIHGVDGAALAEELDRRAREAGIVQPVLLQLNLAGEVSKSGIAEADLLETLDALAGLAGLELRGLMTIPPPVERAEQSRPWFARLREAAVAAREHTGLDLPELSMGMTDDFEVAVEEGATVVRVGRAIFGERPADA